MAELQECITDDSWKQSLQSEIITALTESGQTQNHALEQVGYYYQCCAPAFLYKYYRDQPLNLNSVMSNKMWYSAPRNFNDAFDCDIAIDEQAIFNNLLPAISGGKTIRKGSSACGSRWDDENKGALLDAISPSAIFLGCCASDELTSTLKQYCQNFNIPLYKMEKDPLLYRLNKISLLDFSK